MIMRHQYHPERYYRTWIEIDTAKLRANVSGFLSRVPKQIRIMAVIKSNAYGHGIVGIAKALAAFSQFKKRGWFGVDSITEAARLRKERVMLPILVLGYIVPERIAEAAKQRISITVSTFQSLRAVARCRGRISIHLKFDTGMHRQGFYEYDIPAIFAYLEKHGRHIILEGVYTHFASAKDERDMRMTHAQYAVFERIVGVIRDAYPDVIAHASASGGTLLFPHAHADMVRIGMALYGYFPSWESKRSLARSIRLQPILQWKSIVSELKIVKNGEGVGYDMTEKVKRKSMLAVIPIGYWHGFDRGLSSRGTVLIRGKRVKVIGRVSMSMITVDVTGIMGVNVGDIVTVIGTSGAAEQFGEEIATMLGTTVYEVLTRINPLVYKIYA